MELSYFPRDYVPAALPADNAFQYVRRLRPSTITADTEAPPAACPDHLIGLAYQSIPEVLWDVPGRLIGVCQDCQLLWHLYRLRMRDLDVVICPPHWVPGFRLAGMAQVVSGYLAGPTRLCDIIPPDKPRTIDLLILGNLNPAIHPERVQLITSLARLYPTWSVRVLSGVALDDYHKVLQDARFVLRIADADSSDGLLFEATAAGAVVLQNLEGLLIPDQLLRRAAFIPFNKEMPRAELDAVLADEARRQAIVRQAQSQGTYAIWEGLDGALRELEQVLIQTRTRRDLQSRAARRDRLLARVWQAMAASSNTDAWLVRDLEEAARTARDRATWHNALGVVLSRPERDAAARAIATRAALEHLRKAVELDPNHLVARLNLVWALQGIGDTEAARAEALGTMPLIDVDSGQAASWLDEPHARYEFGYFRVAWEKAAWLYVAEPEEETRAKMALVCWQLHSVLAGSTGAVAHHYEAYLAQPELTPSLTALGQRLTQAETPLLALPYLSRAVQANPFDSGAARSLFDLLGRLGESQAQSLFGRDRLRLRWISHGLLGDESWAQQAPPPPDELVSIMILCCNVAEMTRLCLESLLETTPAPYELILVDNGSTDETPALLKELQTRPGPQRFVIIRNETNVGYPRGCNQALAEARGRFLVFLNNDVVLPPGWLEGLLENIKADWPSIGAVGPVTNYAPHPQLVRPSYNSLEGLVPFAQQRRVEFSRQTLDVRRITGFCLLTRREVLDRVGAFDGRFEVGFFDDDDLCVRICDAGWKLRVALDTYIHHFGSRTFRDQKINTRELLLENFKRFKDKWGEERARGYRLVTLTGEGDAGNGEEAPAMLLGESLDTAVPQSPPAAHTRPRITLSMIVKNEEKHLPDCLRTAGDLFDEIVIADTGSADRTREIARQYGARVVEFPWIDSFAAARNASLAEVRTPWVMWLDADDRFDEENRARVKEVIAGLGEEVDARAIKVRSAMDASGSTSRMLDQVRIFPKRPGVAWDYRIHEQILPSVRKLGGDVLWTNIVVDHIGYQDAAARMAKLERNLRLLELDAAERDSDAFTLFNLGWTKLDLNRAPEAYEHLCVSLERSTPDSSIRRKLYDLLAHTCRALNRRDDAQKWLEKGLKIFPDDCEILLHQATVHREQNNLREASHSLEKLLALPPGRYFASLDDGVRGYRTRHQLAELYRAQGRHTEAEIQWRAALEDRPAFAPAALGLGELLLGQQRWPEVNDVADRLGRIKNEEVNAEVMRCRAHFARGEFTEARSRLEELITRQAELVGPRVLLSHVLLQEAEDWPAAEAALLSVLSLDPEHQESKFNLDLLHQNHPELSVMTSFAPRVAVLTLVPHSQDPFLRPFLDHYLELGIAEIHLVAVDPAVPWPDFIDGHPSVRLHELNLSAGTELNVQLKELRDQLVQDVAFLLVTELDELLVPRHGDDLEAVLNAYQGETVLRAITYEVLPGRNGDGLDPNGSLLGQRKLGVRRREDMRPAVFSAQRAPRWGHKDLLTPLFRYRFGRSDLELLRERLRLLGQPAVSESDWRAWRDTPEAVDLPDSTRWRSPLRLETAAVP
jgi:GT2 family glycosyltransferase/tetratricopeptide (TPR) repeat protein